MPHEKINHPRRISQEISPGLYAPEPNSPLSAKIPKDQLVVAWNEIGWVQVSVYPDGWSSTGDAEHVELNPQELDLLIKTLQRAKRQAYSKGNRHSGFEDTEQLNTRPLFTARP